MSDGGSDTPATRLQKWMATASVLAAVLPIAVATVRGLANHWLAIGDNAYFVLRSRDVLTAHHPLLGTWTSASLAAGVNMNNIGPLQWDALALPARLGGDGGVAVGVALLNIAAVVGIALVARRLGGPLFVTAAMAMAAGLSWTMGSDLLYEPWQPHALLLPFLCFLTLVWALAAGDLVLLPWAVGMGSFILETHLSYAVLVPVLAGAGALGLAWELRRQPGVRRQALRMTGISVVVFLVCWSQPLAEQLTSDGEGNLSRLLANGGRGETKAGARLAVRLVAKTVALPPWWGRPSFGQQPVFGVIPIRWTAATSSASLLAVFAALAGCAWWTRRRGARRASAAAVMAAVGLAATLLTVTTLPVTRFGVAPHQMRFVWPVSVFVTFALALSLGTMAARAFGATKVTAACMLITVVLGGLNLPTWQAHVGPSSDQVSIPVARKLISQLGVLEGTGPLLFDVRDLRFAEPYSVVVMTELQRRGIEFKVDNEGMVRQLGDARRFTGHATGRLVEREGSAAYSGPPGSVLVARAEGLSAEQNADLTRSRDEISRHVADEGLRLSPFGRRSLGVTDLALFARLADGAGAVHDARPLLVFGELTTLLDNHLLDLDRVWRPRFEHVEGLLRKQAATVALFLAPVERAG